MALKDVYQAVIDHDHIKIVNLIKKEVDAGTDISVVLNEGLIAPMDEVGKRFGMGLIYIPEMIVAARAMKAGVEMLRPYLIESGISAKGAIVFGTVKGDLHDIGKNLVIMMLEGKGFKVIDLGVDVNNDTFLEAAKKNKADIVAMSALLNTTLPNMEESVAFLKQEVPKIKIMVGGAPVTENFAKKIGADGYRSDAAGAVKLAHKLIHT